MQFRTTTVTLWSAYVLSHYFWACKCVCIYFFELHCASQTRGHPFKLSKERSYSSVRASYFSVRVINVSNSLPAVRVDFSSFAAFKQTIEQIDFSQFLFGYDNWTCIGRVFCNSLVFYVCVFYFILWAVVSAGYSALLSSSYFERINDDDDDDNG